MKSIDFAMQGCSRKCIGVQIMKKQKIRNHCPAGSGEFWWNVWLLQRCRTENGDSLTLSRYWNLSLWQVISFTASYHLLEDFWLGILLAQDFCFSAVTDMRLAAASLKWFVILMLAFFVLLKSKVRVLVLLKFQGKISYIIVLFIEATKKQRFHFQG